ncbi:hypothetical protein ACOSQ4_006714 [Xanthoceras sorbifolium]
MEDPLEDRAEAYVEDSADDRVDDDRVEDQAEPHMEDPPENRVDDDRVEDPAKAHVEALAEDRVDDDGVLKDRVDDRVEDAADDRVKLEKDFILFLYGISFYHNKEFVGAGNNLFNFFPVLKASLLKRHLSCPYSPNRFFLKLWKPNTLIASTQNLQTGRLYTVTQVEESNFLLKMIPMRSTFLVIGLAASTRDTVFSEQGEHLDSTDFTFYMVIFFLTSKKGVSNTQLQLSKIVRIWFGMVWNEVHRLQILPKSLNNYASTMIGFVVDGIGNFLGILFVYANRQLFSATMNESHLGKYNFQLMILSFLNMCYYYPISVIYILIRYARSDMVERDHITINQ